MISGHWQHLGEYDGLQRSSHIVSAIKNKVYVFGGELVPREPRDNNVFEINASGDIAGEVVKELTLTSQAAPSPRVGSASAVLSNTLYLFSGRGGIAMKPVEENGRLHQFDPASSSWTIIEPADASQAYPEARSYHCMTSDQKSILYVHAGCPEKGRLADLWSFDLNNRSWTQLPDAPGPQRGGTSITYVDGKLYRMNGFDGKTEQGGLLDVFDIASKTWSTTSFQADGISGPEARSVGALVPVKIKGRDKLVTLFGERDPSSLGHAGAGKMLADWWIYNIEDQSWEQGQDDGVSPKTPAARGWFDATALDDGRLAVVGGLSESNDRLKDVWLLSC